MKPTIQPLPVFKPLRIYIAGSWEDRDEVHELMEYVNAHPRLAVVMDWTVHEWGDKYHMRQCAMADKQGVHDCDVFVIHDPAKTSKGKMTELGMAMAWRKPVVTYKTAWTGIFTYLRPKCHANTPGGLVNLLLGN